jgi:DNA repair exonuclease SbcCD nuclease subunit
MKIACITDTHIGGKGSSLYFQEYQKKCFQWFFDYIDKNEIRYIIHLGDLFDVRKHVTYPAAKLARECFFEPIVERGIFTHILCGNHDQHFKNTHEINSLDELIKGKYECIEGYTTPTIINIGGLDIQMLPWITDSNRQESMEAIETPRASVLMGHLELKDFIMHKGQISTNGMDMGLLGKWGNVYSGHYHHRSTVGNVTYLGSFLEMTWADYNDPRGFSVFDTDTQTMEFIENPHNLFWVIVYDDVETVDILGRIQTTDFGFFKDKFIKVLCVNRTNQTMFDLFLDNLYKASPLDVTIIEDATLLEGETEIDIGETHDTVSIINDYINNLTLKVDSDKLKRYMNDIYKDALELGSVE